MNIIELALTAMKWTNENQGVLSVILFILAALYGWLSGIFSALRRKPKFNMSTIPGPTFCCTYATGNRYKEHDTHQTGIVIYLNISNVGATPSSIHNVSIAYHWNLKSWSILRLKYSIGWFWLKNQAVARADFQIDIGEKTKVYPFLFQINQSSPISPNNFLEIGQSTNGIVYFEQPESWGGCSPKVKNQTVTIKLAVSDVFGNLHTSKVVIPAITLDEARKFNPEFGKTLSKINGSTLPHDEVKISN